MQGVFIDILIYIEKGDYFYLKTYSVLHYCIISLFKLRIYVNRFMNFKILKQFGT